MNKSLLLSISLVVLVCLAFIGFSVYKNSYQEVTLKAPNNSTLSLYKGSISETDDVHGYEQHQPLTSTSSEVVKRVKRGSYVYVIRPVSKDYNTIIKSIDITKKPVFITSQLTYTDTKLASLSTSFKPTVASMLENKYPVTMQSYSVSDVRVFGDGSWIAAILKPADSNQDTYIAVFSNNDGRVNLVTAPPSIVISSPVYPQIPKDIVSSIDRFAGIGF